jgi:flagellar hook assembly protein FlgD
MRSEARFVLELGQPAAELRVRVFDVAGRLVHEIRREGVESGIHEIPWDGRTMADGQVSDGIYFILATADRQYRETAKVLVAR